MWEPSGLFKSLVKNQGIAKLAAQRHDKRATWSYIASKWKQPNLTLMWVSSPLGVYWCGLNESGEGETHLFQYNQKLSKQQEVSCVLHGVVRLLTAQANYAHVFTCSGDWGSSVVLWAWHGLTWSLLLGVYTTPTSFHTTDLFVYLFWVERQHEIDAINNILSGHFVLLRLDRFFTVCPH